MYTVLTIFILVASILMVLIVLVQNSKGGGLSAGFSSSNQIMGAPKTADFLEKATWTLAGAIMILCILSSWALPKSQQSTASEIVNQVNEAAQTDPALAAPGFETSATTQQDSASN